MATARNVLIILALAAIVQFAPGGGDTAALVNAILLHAAERRLRLLRRALLPRAPGRHLLARRPRPGAAVRRARRDRARARRRRAAGWTRAAGTAVWIVLIGGSIAALVTVFRQYREYGG